ncbi:MAG: cyclopropane-fatty-acyl-phospholipid synthase family protein [Gammaproteobacteria bacterium]|jgi:cyclopropane-fatty-acyl-phospholipid synthase|nr:SAM-dependent methyltransferase [Gammaproteobacteria bacterium]MDP6094520.1 cyclopropane-fatty-acyl-phospholipid synthase family protein [Gammaproteobacteria bacterium]MDP7455600.1 cyclopropane-fatty-acyl-phospholipid synthase family protein [Gammaproteobacteria bacterium]|tara:strand:- start:2033 stop:3211 length:1179 start_codon:yes stop_codon:yes gene_type:complete
MYLKLLKKGITYGQMTLKLPGGKVHHFGDHGPHITWVIHNERTINKIAKNWEFELGETYIAGEWDVEDGSLYDLLSILRYNFQILKLPFLFKQFSTLGKIFQQWNHLTASRENVAHHYDLDRELFSHFLDKSQIYSCAYFNDDDNLEQAQVEKCHHIARKLLLEPGQSVLDIGCGWGSLALFLAQHFDVNVTGLTLSKEQYEVACQRASDLQLIGKVNFKLEDYREHDSTYDRIVSIGMFEHVGKDNFSTYFDKVDSSLNEQGVALIHTIARTGQPRKTNPWIEKYIFPGGYLPSLSEMSASVEETRLEMTDIEILSGHYERTLAAWRKSFLEHRDKFAAIKDEKFCRVWEFYLTSSEATFRHTRLTVFQMQLAKQRGIVPLKRDYMYQKTK